MQIFREIVQSDCDGFTLVSSDRYNERRGLRRGRKEGSEIARKE
jgi:hypothetical protein